jgi:hypothetical protein
MTTSLASLLFLLLAAPAKSSKLEQGSRLFTAGDFEGALKALDLAVTDTPDQATLERVHLLRGQCFAARQDYARAEEAFALALEADPEAALDPARVDPTVVKLLEAVRKRSTGTLVLTSAPPGASVWLDGKKVGEAPLTVGVAAGRHRAEAGWGGATAPTEVVVHPRRETRTQWIQVAIAAEPAPPQVRVLKPFGDIRATVEVPSLQQAPLTWGLDFGGGVEVSSFRLGAWARLFPYFGVTPRAAYFMSVMDRLTLYLEAELPLFFRGSGIALGLGGSVGAEFSPLRFLGVFLQIGGQHLFLNPGRSDNTHFTSTAGVRFRVP